MELVQEYWAIGGIQRVRLCLREHSVYVEMSSMLVQSGNPLVHLRAGLEPLIESLDVEGDAPQDRGGQKLYTLSPMPLTGTKGRKGGSPRTSSCPSRSLSSVARLE